MGNKYEALIERWTDGAKKLRKKEEVAEGNICPKVASQLGAAAGMLEECIKELKQSHEN